MPLWSWREVSEVFQGSCWSPSAIIVGVIHCVSDIYVRAAEIDVLSSVVRLGRGQWSQCTNLTPRVGGTLRRSWQLAFWRDRPPRLRRSSLAPPGALWCARLECRDDGGGRAWLVLGVWFLEQALKFGQVFEGNNCHGWFAVTCHHYSLLPEADPVDKVSSLFTERFNWAFCLLDHLFRSYPAILGVQAVFRSNRAVRSLSGKRTTDGIRPPFALAAR